jgi:hypothetical protein
VSTRLATINHSKKIQKRKLTPTLVVRVNLYNTLAAAKYNKISKERILK